MRRCLFITILILLFLPDGKSQERVIETISYTGSALPLLKTIYVAEPGYLIAEADSLTGVHQVEISFTDSVSLRTEVNQARIDFPGNIAIKLYQRSGYPVSIGGQVSIRFYPLGDVLEPNDRPEQAALVQVNTWYQMNLFPASDRDHFLVEVKKEGWLSPETREDPRSFQWQLFEAGGQSLSNTFPYRARPGNYIVGVSRYSGSAGLEPLHLKINLLPESDQLEPNDSVAVPIAIDKYYSVGFATPQDQDRFLVKTKGKNFVTIRSYQALPSSVNFETTINDKTYSGNPLVIPPGQKELEIRMSPRGTAYRKPFYIRVEETGRMDPTEPNDSLPDATPLTRSKGLYLSIYPASDEDWFRISMEGPGRIILNLSDAVAAASYIGGSYNVELFDTAGQKLNLAVRETASGMIYASEYIKEKGDWYLKMTARTATAEEQLLALRVFGPGVPGAVPDGDSFDDIYFIGFELDTSANLLLAALSESANANFTLVDSAASLDKVLNEVFAEAKRNKGTRSWLPYAAIGLVLVAAGAYAFRKKLTSRTRSKT